MDKNDATILLRVYFNICSAHRWGTLLNYHGERILGLCKQWLEVKYFMFLSDKNNDVTRLRDDDRRDFQGNFLMHIHRYAVDHEGLNNFFFIAER